MTAYGAPFRLGALRRRKAAPSPYPVVGILCRARTQHVNCRMSERYGAAVQRAERLFKKAAARIQSRIYKSLNVPDIDDRLSSVRFVVFSIATMPSLSFD